MKIAKFLRDVSVGDKTYHEGDEMKVEPIMYYAIETGFRVAVETEEGQIMDFQVGGPLKEFIDIQLTGERSCSDMGVQIDSPKLSDYGVSYAVDWVQSRTSKAINGDYVVVPTDRKASLRDKYFYVVDVSTEETTRQGIKSLNGYLSVFSKKQ